MVVRRRPQRGHRFTESPVLQLALQGWRSRTVGLLLMGAFLALVGRGFYLQVINNDFLQQKGDSVTCATSRFPPRAARSSTATATCWPYRRR